PVTVPFRTTFLLFSLTTPLPPISTPFPYTTLFRSRPSVLPSQSQTLWPILQGGTHVELRTEGLRRILDLGSWTGLAIGGLSVGRSEEHTSNSSHQIISYAVFCLKKKITTNDNMITT